MTPEVKEKGAQVYKHQVEDIHKIMKEKGWFVPETEQEKHD